MKKSVTPCMMGIAIAGAGVLLAIAPGEAQAAPVTISATSLFGFNFSPPTPNALVGTAANEPLFGPIGLAGQIPIVNIFIANGANGAPSSGANGGNAGLLIGYGGSGGSGAPAQPGGNGGNG